MNVALMKKFEKEFMWWFKNPTDRTIMIKYDNEWQVSHGCFCYTEENGAKITAIVNNDEYAKYRMAEADGETIQLKLETGEWDDINRAADWSCKPDDYRIKPSWKWQDEISLRGICCKDLYGELFIAKDYDESEEFLYSNGNDTHSDLEPITVADLHDFQRKGYYSIDELCDIHDKEFYPHKGATSAVSFLDWLREREQ